MKVWRAAKGETSSRNEGCLICIGQQKFLYGWLEQWTHQNGAPDAEKVGMNGMNQETQLPLSAAGNPEPADSTLSEGAETT